MSHVCLFYELCLKYLSKYINSVIKRSERTNICAPAGYEPRSLAARSTTVRLYNHCAIRSSIKNKAISCYNVPSLLPFLLFCCRLNIKTVGDNSQFLSWYNSSSAVRRRRFTHERSIAVHRLTNSWCCDLKTKKLSCLFFCWDF